MQNLGHFFSPKEVFFYLQYLDELMGYIDQQLETLYKQLLPQIFPRIVEDLWEEILMRISSLMQAGKPPVYYHELRAVRLSCTLCQKPFFSDMHILTGYYTPNQKLACLVMYLKIINTFLKNNVCILKQIVQGNQKWHWNFSRPSGF